MSHSAVVMNSRHAVFAQVALLAIAAVWGATFVMVQDAVREMPVLTFLAYRFLAAAGIVAFVFRRQLRALSAAGWRAGMLMGVFLTLGYVLQTVALLHTTAANAGFITGLFVVFTPLLAAATLRVRVPAVTWAGAAVSAVGLALLAEWAEAGIRSATRSRSDVRSPSPPTYSSPTPVCARTRSAACWPCNSRSAAPPACWDLRRWATS